MGEGKTHLTIRGSLKPYNTFPSVLSYSNLQKRNYNLILSLALITFKEDNRKEQSHSIKEPSIYIKQEA